MYLDVTKVLLFIICVIAIIMLTTITRPINVQHYNNSYIVIVGIIPIFLIAFTISCGVGFIVYNYYFSDND